MSQYALPSDLKRYSGTTIFLRDIPDIDQEFALKAASDLADSYLQTKFVLPLTQWGQDLVRCVCAIALYDIAVRRGYNPEAGADVNIRLRYEDQISWLKGIATEQVAPFVVDSGTQGIGSFSESSESRGWSDRGSPNPPGPFQGD